MGRVGKCWEGMGRVGIGWDEMERVEKVEKVEMGREGLVKSVILCFIVISTLQVHVTYKNK